MPTTRRMHLARSLVAAVAAGALVGGLMAVPATAAAQPGAPALVADPASLVNPIIGTSGGVNTFPGPDMPFGMMQWSPDTSPNRPSGGGYEYNSSQISGFSLTHISGPGAPAYGDIPILPLVGAIPANPGGATVNFSHASETAKAGYYEVTTTSPDASSNPVITQLTTTMRAGLAQFTFPASTQSNLLLKVAGSASQMDGTTAQVVGDDEVIGSVTAGHFDGGDVYGERDYTLHFDIRFQQPFAASGTWAGGPNGGPGGVYLTFDTTGNQTVAAKVGISFTSDANAALNLNTEIPGWDFGAVRNANEHAWNDVLGRIEIAGGTANQQTQFYTALYHTLLHPNVFSDVNGQYMGMDGNVHTAAAGHDQYANYSGWDIYRSQVQLAALVAPHQTSDSVRSMLNDYDQTGLLPMWALANGETYDMVGDPADPIIADAYAFGARDFDAQKALQDMVTEATTNNNIRPAQSVLDQYGYLPYDMPFAGVSKQLEFDTADYAIAALAKSLGQHGIYTKFATRAQNWQNVFNTATGYMQPKLKSGQWMQGFTPSSTYGFTEGTSAQYTPMVPFNLHMLIAARGGNQAWESYLDSLFTNIAHPSSTNAKLSNEPSLEIPWEYDYVGAPWKTQQVVREAQTQLYFNAPVGQFGNDDLGSMSSWYVWSNLGMYPETPGTDTLVFGSPVFPHAVVHLANGKNITIDAPKAATDAPYVQNLQLNGQDWPKTYLAGNQYQHGATLSFDLATTPNTSWGSGPNDAPPSDATGEQAVLTSVSPSNLILTPGSSGSASFDVTNLTSQTLTVDWTASAASGVTVGPTSGSLTIRASSSGTATVTVTGGQNDGIYPVTFSARTASGTTSQGATLGVDVAKAGEFWPYYNNIGISNDNDPGAANYDAGGRSYSAQALHAAGVDPGSTLTANGIAYTWPTVPAGQFDNIVAIGQTIPVAFPAGATTIGWIGSANNVGCSGATGTLTVTYTDGSTQQIPVGFSDWTLGGGGCPVLPSEKVVAATQYRNNSNPSIGMQMQTTYVFATSAALQPGKTVASVTLPTPTGGAVHVFDIGTD